MGQCQIYTTEYLGNIRAVCHPASNHWAQWRLYQQCNLLIRVRPGIDDAYHRFGLCIRIQWDAWRTYGRPGIDADDAWGLAPVSHDAYMGVLNLGLRITFLKNLELKGLRAFNSPNIYQILRVSSTQSREGVWFFFNKIGVLSWEKDVMSSLLHMHADYMHYKNIKHH